MNWTFKNILSIAATLLILYCVGVLSIYIFINGILFKTERVSNYKFQDVKNLEEVTISLPDQQSIPALFYKSNEGESGIVLVLHGAGGNLDRHLVLIDQFQQRNLSVLMPEFRGFGKAKGSVNENTLQEDALASMDWIRKRYREDSIIIYAKDFSASSACYVASMFPCRLLILEDPVFSLRSWMRDRFNALILPYELKYDFTIADVLPNSLVPVYILRPQGSANCNAKDAIKMQHLLKDPNGLIQFEKTKGQPIYELEQYQQLMDQLLSF